MTYCNKLSTGVFRCQVALPTVLLDGWWLDAPPLRFAAGAADDATEHLPNPTGLTT